MSDHEYLFDVETNGFLEKLTKIHCLVITDVNTGKMWSYGPDNMDEGINRLEKADVLIGHNIIEFDLKALRKVYPNIKLTDKIVDTLVLSKLIYSDLLKDRDFANPNFPKHQAGNHGLEAWGWRLGFRKGNYAKEKKAEGKDAWAEWSHEMQGYCETDVELNFKLYEQMMKEMYSPVAIELEHEVALLCSKMMENGFPFHKERAVNLLAELQAKRAELDLELQREIEPWFVGAPTPTVPKLALDKQGYWGDVSYHVPPEWPEGKPYLTKSGTITAQAKVAGVRKVFKGYPYTKVTEVSFNPSSRPHIARFLKKKYGWNPTEFTKEGDPVVDEDVLEALPYPEAKRFAEYFLLQKRIGQIGEGREAWLRYYDERTGRVYTRIDPNGAGTGRATHKQFNIAQVPSSSALYGSACRDCFYVPHGVLVGTDASGLELRCLGHFMARYDGGAYIDLVLNGDIHWVTVQAIFPHLKGVARDKHNPEHEKCRAIAKTFDKIGVYKSGELRGTLYETILSQDLCAS